MTGPLQLRDTLLRFAPGTAAGLLAIVSAAWFGQIWLLLPGLALAYVLLRRVSTTPLALLILLIGASLLDRLTVPLRGASIRPDLIIAIPTTAYVATMILRSKDRQRLFLPDFLLLGWLLLNGLASLFAPAPRQSLRTWISLLLAASAYFAIRWLARGRLRETMRLLLTMGAVACIAGVAAYLLGPLGWSFGIQFNRDAHVLMATGSFKEADIFGSFAACLLILSAGWLVTRQSIQWLGWLGLTSSALALAASLARTAWLAAVIGVLCSIVLWRRRLISLGGVLSIAAVVALLGGAVFSILGTSEPRSTVPTVEAVDLSPVSASPTASVRSTGGAPEGPVTVPVAKTTGVAERIKSLLNWQSDPTVQGRLSAARLVISDWEKSPVIGRGTASFGEIYADSSHQPAWIFNIELRALHDTGLVGLALFLVFGIALTVATLKAASNPTLDVSGMLVVASVVLWAAAQGTEPFQLMWPWSLLGLMAAAASSREATRLPAIEQVLDKKPAENRSIAS